MAVTRQEYSIEPTWNSEQLLDTLVGPALIDAGLMTNWYDSFEITTRDFRVLEVEYNALNTYGKLYYVFATANNSGYLGITIATGWDATNHVPLGDQFLDYHLAPADNNSLAYDWQNSPVMEGRSYTTRLTLTRYSSQDNPNQNWFIFRQGTHNATPFSILSGSTQLYSHLDLDKGCISGLSFCYTTTSSHTGYLSFSVEENLRRVLGLGQILHGTVDTTYGNDRYHGLSQPPHVYFGAGRFINAYNSNQSGRGDVKNGAVPLPIGYSTSNPAYTSNYSPICTDLPWTLWSSEPLATDFGVYMHYADNNITYNDRFVVDPGVEEWEVISFTNNATVDFGASPCFIARVV